MLVPRKRARSAEYIVDKVRRRTTSAEVRTSKWKVACCCTLSCTYTKHPTGIVVEYAIDQISFRYSYVGEDLEHILTLICRRRPGAYLNTMGAFYKNIGVVILYWFSNTV